MTQSGHFGVSRQVQLEWGHDGRRIPAIRLTTPSRNGRLRAGSCKNAERLRVGAEGIVPFDGAHELKPVLPLMMRWTALLQRHPDMPPCGVIWGTDDVRFGSKADIWTRTTDVRFTPRSGHFQRRLSCPLSANSGHWLRSHLNGWRVGAVACKRCHVDRSASAGFAQSTWYRFRGAHHPAEVANRFNQAAPADFHLIEQPTEGT